MYFFQFNEFGSVLRYFLFESNLINKLISIIKFFYNYLIGVEIVNLYLEQINMNFFFKCNKVQL